MLTVLEPGLDGFNIYPDVLLFCTIKPALFRLLSLIVIPHPPPELLLLLPSFKSTVLAPIVTCDGAVWFSTEPSVINFPFIIISSFSLSDPIVIIFLFLVLLML